MAHGVVGAEVLHDDAPHAGLVDEAVLGLDEGVRCGDHDGGLHAGLDDVPPRGLEVVVDAAVGGHVVAGRAAEDVKRQRGQGARGLAAEVEQVREAKVLGAVDGGAQGDGAAEHVRDAGLREGHVQGHDAALAVAHDVDLLAAGAVLHGADVVGQVGGRVGHGPEAADPRRQRVRAVRRAEGAEAQVREVPGQAGQADVAVRREPVQQHHGVARRLAVEVVLGRAEERVRDEVRGDGPVDGAGGLGRGRGRRRQGGGGRGRGGSGSERRGTHFRCKYAFSFFWGKGGFLVDFFASFVERSKQIRFLSLFPLLMI